jgi:hypothetical protein
MSNLQDPRVLFALERTALAWNRSGLALIALSAWTSLINRTGIYRRLSDPTSSLAEFIYHADGYSIDDFILDSLSLSSKMRCGLILDSTVDTGFA